MMEYAYNPNTWKTETEKQEFKDIAMSKPAKNSLVKKIIILEIQTSSAKKYVDLNLMPYKNKTK